MDTCTHPVLPNTAPIATRCPDCHRLAPYEPEPWEHGPIYLTGTGATTTGAGIGIGIGAGTKTAPPQRFQRPHPASAVSTAATSRPTAATRTAARLNATLIVMTPLRLDPVSLAEWPRGRGPLAINAGEYQPS